MKTKGIMRRPVLRVLAIVVAFNVAMALVVLFLRRRMPSEGDEQSDEIALAAAGGGIELQSRATAFRGGSARAILGGIELDLRNATLDPGGGSLDVRAIVGGVELVIPDDWRIRVASKRATLGGIDLPPSVEEMPAGEGPVLDLSLLAVFGGVEVSVKARDTSAALA